MPFPNFDPVLIHIGPIAIRWYALAYIAGIILAWRYAVALCRNQKLWRGTAPIATDRQIDDTRALDHPRYPDRAGGWAACCSTTPI